ncbi:MAG: hypothetical protein ABJM67_03735, partial [Rhodopirellula bahusiensis]
QTQKRNGPGQAGYLRFLRNEPTLNSPTIRQYSSLANAGPNTIAPVPFDLDSRWQRTAHRFARQIEHVVVSR